MACYSKNTPMQGKQNHFYHYTSEENFRAMRDGEIYGQTGLIPIRRVLRIGLSKKFNLPAKAEEGAVYGLLEPAPRVWMDQEYYPGEALLETVLDDIRGSGKMLLLKCTVAPEDDIYVADHVFHMRTDYNGREDLKNPVTKQVKRAYWKSMVPFGKYKGQHEVPEVICFDAIPIERIKIEKVYESRWHLLNELRAGADRPLIPPKPKPDPKAIEALLRDLSL